MIVDSFADLTETSTINFLKKKQAIFIPHRYVQVYCNLDLVEKTFPIPIFGNRYLLKYEQRAGTHNQYQLFESAQIDHPQQYKDPREIDRLVLIKVQEAQRSYERAFFTAHDHKEFTTKAENLIKSGKILASDLENATIEEFLIGAQINFNFFYSPLKQKLELLGTDIRRQTNLDGYLRIPSVAQQEIDSEILPSFIEVGHIAITVKESLLESAFRIAERLIESTRTFIPPGILGPFALQTAVVPGPPKEKIVVYDLSLRMPGSPGTSFTPYSQYHFGHTVSFGQRIAIEIKEALKSNTLGKITT